MKMHDKDIRTALNEKLNTEFKDDPDTLIVNELNLCYGEARIDVAVVNGYIHGYEIKSESDTLERLPKQIEVYNKVCDNITIVIGKNHLDQVMSIVPPGWGITVASPIDKYQVGLETIRHPLQNKEVDAFSIAQFLWREELLKLLLRYDLDKKARRLPKYKLWAYLSEQIPLNELRDYVKYCLKTRKGWRPDAQRMSNDGWY